jgi:hypothetical protein
MRSKAGDNGGAVAGCGGLYFRPRFARNCRLGRWICCDPAATVSLKNQRMFAKRSLRDHFARLQIPMVVAKPEWQHSGNERCQTKVFWLNHVEPDTGKNKASSIQQDHRHTIGQSSNPTVSAQKVLVSRRF